MKPNNYYRIVHTWINKHYGKATHCENPECSKKSKKYQYCLKHGFDHDRKRENYITLCVSCHRKYDNLEKDGKEIAKHIAGKFNENLRLGPISRQKKILLVSEDKTFDSGKDLAKYLGCDKSSIYQVLSGRRKTIYGQKLRYADN